jgi:hypothetical protein
MALPCVPFQVCMIVDSDGNYNGFVLVGGVLYVIQITNATGVPGGYVLSIIGSDGTNQLVYDDPRSTCDNIFWPPVVISGTTCQFQILNNSLCCASVGSSSVTSVGSFPSASSLSCNCNLPGSIHVTIGNTFNCNQTLTAAFQPSLNAWVSNQTSGLISQCRVGLQCSGSQWRSFTCAVDFSNIQYIAEGPAVANCDTPQSFLVRFDQVKELGQSPCLCGNISGTLTWTL